MHDHCEIIKKQMINFRKATPENTHKPKLPNIDQKRKTAQYLCQHQTHAANSVEPVLSIHVAVMTSQQAEYSRPL